VHYFSTFFYPKLYTDKKGYVFENVQRWTGKLTYALHECDKIVVPIHLGMHWVLAVCDLKNKQLRYLDSMGGYEVDALVGARAQPPNPPCPCRSLQTRRPLHGAKCDVGKAGARFAAPGALRWTAVATRAKGARVLRRKH